MQQPGFLMSLSQIHGRLLQPSATITTPITATAPNKTSASVQ